MYYRIFDEQTNRYLATGYNESLVDMLDSYCSYVYNDGSTEEDWKRHWNNMSTQQQLDYIQTNDFVVEMSEIPFEDYE